VIEHGAQHSDGRSHAAHHSSTATAAEEIVVRRAGIADLATVVELRIALLKEHAANPLYRNLRPDASARARRLFAAQLRSPNEVIFLAEQQNSVVGILRCMHASSLPLLSPSAHGYISSVYVRPAARRHGVLHALLDAAMRWCKARGLTEIRLHTAAENDVANAAWQALGFEIAEHLRVRQLRSSL
jgi:ribosomal protein S18 acetylase RimI-like enzyme